MNFSNVNKPNKISLFLSDVDGTILTKEKVLTQRSKEAVDKIYRAGIKFSLTSSRSPRGLAALIEQLKVSAPVGAFNGAIFAMPDLKVIKTRTLSKPFPEKISQIITDHGLDVWLYKGNDWFISSAKNPHVAREESISKVSPILIKDSTHLEEKLTDDIAKIVGVSDDYAAVATCETNLQELFSENVSAHRSQPYFLDITDPGANKGAIVDMLAGYFSIDAKNIATIGDMFNDVSMFKQSGISIAMGNASLEVQKQAQYVTDTNEEEGFAKAVERFILND
jgi:Cof subfamily protein (haloacid dehalogenase superfamily)